MSETMRYFEEEDIIHLIIKSGKEARSVEMSPNITVEMDENGDMIGIEIQNASRFIRDGLMETIQARLLQENP
jgi:uncharacterized protein YuzE